MDSDEVPPPPYSAVDPLLAPSNSNRNATSSSNATPSLLHLRSGDARFHGPSAAPIPTYFTSAAAYFAERPPPAIEDGEQTLEHHMTIYPRSQAKDFPRRPRCWSPRMEHIAQQDWDMFLRHLFPPHLGLASSSAELPRQVRAEIRRDRKDRPQETDEERERRIATVMKEWNQYFFELRAVRIVFFYVTDPRAAPISPLCPRCYPAATRATQDNRTTQNTEAGRGHPLPPNAHPAATGYPQAGMYPGQPSMPYGYPNPAVPAPFPPQQGSGFFHPANPHAYQNPYPQYQPWGWGGSQYPQQDESSSMKGGPLGWLSSLASSAQKYGDRITEQAAHYGRQVEEQALAHGRWIEEQAGLGGRKVETAYSGWGAPQQGYYPYYYPPPTAAATTAITATPTLDSTQQAIQQTPQPTTPQPAPQSSTQRPRSNSVCSVSSDSSLSSIDSISTTSELSSSDLATVRAQLLSLDDHHDRDLYEAAVELRRQLDALRESRRQARISGRGRWRHGWGHQSRHNDSSSGQGRSSWGRWESPQDRQRNAAERRAAKEELRATRKAFREVLKRAREEQREQRRMKRTRRRQQRRARRGQNRGEEPASAPAPVSVSASASEPVSVSAGPPPEGSLEQRLQNLELENNRETRTTVLAGSTGPSQQRTDAGSESSAVSSIGTPSASSDEGEDTKKNKEKEKKKKLGKETK